MIFYFDSILTKKNRFSESIETKESIFKKIDSFFPIPNARFLSFNNNPSRTGTFNVLLPAPLASEKLFHPKSAQVMILPFLCRYNSKLFNHCFNFKSSFHSLFIMWFLRVIRDFLCCCCCCCCCCYCWCFCSASWYGLCTWYNYWSELTLHSTVILVEWTELNPMGDSQALGWLHHRFF
jgi:hypothetical protein